MAKKGRLHLNLARGSQNLQIKTGWFKSFNGWNSWIFRKADKK